MVMQTQYEDIVTRLDNDQLWDFPGGIHPADRKTLSNHLPIAKMRIPEVLHVTVKQHIGVEGRVIVELGQQVLKGQALTKSTNPFAVPVHAPSSGTVLSIDNHPTPHPSGIPEITVSIQTDGADTWIDHQPMVDYQQQSKMDVLGKICDAGISGMGGAGFPSHIKLSSQKDVEFLIINGVECEPYISSDDRLMREHAWQIRQGIDVLTHLISPKHVIIAIENNKPEAIEAMQIACRENPLYRVVNIPDKYPSGGEKQLIQILTNREVPAQGLPIDVGVLMHNVATCYAVADAIFTGKPLVERVVTVTGESVGKPGNYWIALGTPIQHILAESDYLANKQSHPNVIMGGPMMGFTVTDESVPIVKTSNCILIPADTEISELNEQACIRCGACADVCPANLLPQQMYWHAKAKELDKAQEYNLFDCIECGACAYVCPSEIPLVHYYRVAKSEIRAEQEEKQQADKARERFEKRAARLKAEQQARDEKHRLAAEARKQAMASKGNDAKDKIAAALARAKAKKQQASEASTSDVASEQKPEPVTAGPNQTRAIDTDTASQQPASAPAPASSGASNNQRVQAAIARAKAKKAAKAAAESSAEQARSATPDDTDSQTITNNATSEPSTQNEPSKDQQPPPTSMSELTGEPAPELTDKQKKIAAAVARAKAKRAAKQSADGQTDKVDNTLESQEKSQVPSIQVLPTQVSPTDAQTSSELSKASNNQLANTAQNQAEDTGADKPSRASNITESNNSEPSAPESVSTPLPESTNTTAPTVNSEAEQLAAKKRRIAAAVAKAKAKKKAEQAKAQQQGTSE